MEVEIVEMDRPNQPNEDLAKLGGIERQEFIKNIEYNTLRLLQKQKDRIEKVKVKQPTIEVRYQNLCVEVDYKVVDGKPLPTLWNTFKTLFSKAWKIFGSTSQEAKMSILKDVTGIIKPSRLTLLLGPPGCGKTTLLRALSGLPEKTLNVSGEVTYNGYRLDEFVPQKTASYISQYDLHIPEMTVRETLDFSARFQGVGIREEILKEVEQREKNEGIIPDPEIQKYMKSISLEEALDKNIQIDYIMQVMGLDICSDTMVGDAMRTGISGGQKKRLTTAEMIVGQTKAIFMDEISTGLDSSTAFQIVKYLQQVAHISETTLLVSLLQPEPETYELFDDIILMAEGRVVYHGPVSQVLNFFDDCGFRCPHRKATPNFLQEVLSVKDQQQYWYDQTKSYRYISVDEFCSKFKCSDVGENLQKQLSRPFVRSELGKKCLSTQLYSSSKWNLLQACTSREILLMKRNSFIYILETANLCVIACVLMTVFFKTRMEVNLLDSNYYMSALFFAVLVILFNGYSELAITASRLPVFYKQRDVYFYPPWAYSIPTTILKLPISIVESLAWTSITYYVIGYAPEFQRFCFHFLLLLAVHQMSLSLFRFIAALTKTLDKAVFVSTVIMLFIFLFGGFFLPPPSLPGWLRWGFWISPLSYAEIGITVNEFLAPKWQKISFMNPNTTLGKQVLSSRGLDYKSHFYWISIGGLFGFSLLFNVGFTLALTYVRAPGTSQAFISREKLMQKKDKLEEKENHQKIHEKLILPFQPLTLSFQEIEYYVDAPKKSSNSKSDAGKLQLLHGITASCRPGILTALMGVSGAGKTTLMDVLAGRKTGGIIKGEIHIDGYPKVQETFARISGYCEQTDIHSPQITVEESLIFSACLRLPSEINLITRKEFVKDVLQTIELDGIKDAIVGIPGMSGLSREQRKRLTIAVELVSNPSIIFMDEPTSCLDARAAAIVMRAVKNVSATGRTVICTIHQPGIDIFQAFDELILMKSGRLIYSGILGENSSAVIEYFQGIPGVPQIDGYHNPAAWMLHVTTTVETEHGVDFAKLYKDSSMYKENLEAVRKLSSPQISSKKLKFPTDFAQNNWVQFKACLWKQHLSYWRNPLYNLLRLMLMTIMSLTFAVIYWQKGETLNNQQDLYNILGSMFIGIVLTGVNNCSSAIPFIAVERDVLYREKFAGMYSPWVHSFAQMAVELPYSFTQALIFMVIGYPSIGYSITIKKIFWFFYVMFSTLLYFNYLGMFIVSITPNAQIGSILISTIYTYLNLFAGFIVPKQHIPKWWIWLYYAVPTSWSLNGFFTSQYGDVKKGIQVFDQTIELSKFIRDYIGYNTSELTLVAAILLAYIILHASLFAYCIGKLNFQMR